jgi:hypothetical protein
MTRHGPLQRVMAMDFLSHLRPHANGPCLVMLEANAPGIFATWFTDHPRQVNILDWHSRKLGFSFTLFQMPRIHRLHLLLLSYESAFLHTINLGMLSNAIFRPPYDEARIQDQTSNDRRGLHVRTPDAVEQLQFKSDYAAQSNQRVPTPTPLDPGHYILIDDLQRSPNGERAQFVWIVMPLITDLTSYPVYPDSQKTSLGEIPIIDLGRPDLYPQLYQPEMWTNNQHLSERGAKLASQLMASLLLQWTNNHPMHLNCGG